MDMDTGFLTTQISEDEVLTDIERHLESKSVAKAAQVAREALASYPESRRIRDKLIAALEHQGEASEAYGLARSNAFRHLARLEEVHRPSQDPEKTEPNRRIFICGYFYSGSGAVLDFLRDLDGVRKWPPTGEMRLIKFPGGLADLSSRFEKAGGLEDKDLVDFYLHLIGEKVVFPKKGKYSKWKVVNRNSRSILSKKASSGYLHAFFRAFGEIERFRKGSGVTHGEFELFLRDLVEVALSNTLDQAKADILVVDQAVTAWRMPIARLVPPSTFILVHRDPRDQFAETREAQGRTGRKIASAAEFVETFRLRRSIPEAHIPALERDYGHRFIQIRFEDFVCEHDLEGPKLLASLGLEARRRVSENFDPSVSRKNIGKHREMISDEDCRTLETLLPEFLDERAEQACK